MKFFWCFADVLVTFSSFFFGTQVKSDGSNLHLLERGAKTTAFLAVQLKGHWTFFFPFSLFCHRCKKRWIKRDAFLSQHRKKSAEAIVGDFVKMIDYAVYKFCTLFLSTTSSNECQHTKNRLPRKTALYTKHATVFAIECLSVNLF